MGVALLLSCRLTRASLDEVNVTFHVFFLSMNSLFPSQPPKSGSLFDAMAFKLWQLADNSAKTLLSSFYDKSYHKAEGRIMTSAWVLMELTNYQENIEDFKILKDNYLKFLFYEIATLRKNLMFRVSPFLGYGTSPDIINQENHSNQVSKVLENMESLIVERFNLYEDEMDLLFYTDPPKAPCTSAYLLFIDPLTATKLLGSREECCKRLKQDLVKAHFLNLAELRVLIQSEVIDILTKTRI